MACALARALGASPWKPQGTMDPPNMLKIDIHVEHDVQQHAMSHQWLALRGRGGRAHGCPSGPLRRPRGILETLELDPRMFYQAPSCTVAIPTTSEAPGPGWN